MVRTVFCAGPGDFDLGRLLAVLGAKTKEMGARRIVFDALDILLTLLPDPATQRREVYRLHDWLLASGMRSKSWTSLRNPSSRWRRVSS